MRFPWNRPLPLGEELESEARRLGVSLEEAWTGGKEGRTKLAEAELQLRVLAARSERRNAVLNGTQTVGIIITIVLTFVLTLASQHRESVKTSADLMLKFDERLSHQGAGRVALALDMDGNLDKRPDITDQDIDEFLGTYELLAAAYRNHLIDDDMAYDAFSYDLEKALQDKKIRAFIEASRAEQPDVFDGVLELARAFGIKQVRALSKGSSPVP
jgi:hypothetical protein